MYWKDSLAKRIINEKSLTYAKLQSYQRDYPQLRVKTLDAAGKIPAIQLQGKSEWMKPREWADDHIRALRAELLEVQTRVVTICGDNECETSYACSLVCQLKEKQGKDLAELDRLREEVRQLTELVESLKDEFCYSQIPEEQSNEVYVDDFDITLVSEV